MSVEDRRFLVVVFSFGMLLAFSAAPEWIRISLGALLMLLVIVVGLTS